MKAALHIWFRITSYNVCYTKLLRYAANPSLTNGLTLWVDATQNVVADGGMVSHWLDVRDTPGAAETNYPWAVLPSGVTAPVVTADGVSFGALGSGRNNFV